GYFDRLVEPGEGVALHELQRLLRRVAGDEIALFRRLAVPLAVGVHYSCTSTPIDRAAPATIFIADSTVSQLRSGILTSAIFLTWAFVSFPTFTRLGCPEPFSSPTSFLMRMAAG